MIQRGKVVIGAALAVGVVAALSGCSSGNWWHPKGPRTHFSIADGCPLHTQSQADVVNPAQATSPLLRTAPMPTSSLVCLYGYWFPDHSQPSPAAANSLIDSVRLNARDSETLAKSILTLSLDQPRGVTSCPEDMVGVRALLAFEYADGSATDLNYHDTGCQSIDNGTVAASQSGSASFGAFQTTLETFVPNR